MGKSAGDSEDQMYFHLRGGQKLYAERGDQLDKAGQTILQLLHRAAGVAEENSRHALETAQSFRISSAQPKIGSRSSKQKSTPMRKEPTEPSSGFIASTQRLKIDFFSRAIAAAR